MSPVDSSVYSSSINGPATPQVMSSYGAAASAITATDHDDAEHNIQYKDPHRGTASRGSALFNIVCTIAGTGILQLPYTLQQSGWVGIAIIILAAFVADYTGKILIACLYYDGKTRLTGYPEIGQAAFGKVGYYIVQFFHKTTLLGVCTLFLILAGGNMDSIIPVGLGATKWTLICAAVVWVPVVALKALKEVSILALFGMLASMITVVVVIVLSLMDYVAEDGYGKDAEHDAIVFATLGSAFAAITFSFGGNAVYPEVEHSMAQPRMFGWSLSWSMFLVTCMYLPTAVIGYLVYGRDTLSPILNNLPTGWAATMAFAVITLHVILAYPIPMVAVVLEAETTLQQWATRIVTGKKKSSSSNKEITGDKVPAHSGRSTAIADYADDGSETSDVPEDDEDESQALVPPGSPHSKSSRNRERAIASVTFLLRFVYRSIVVGVTLLVAIYVPYFAEFMTLLGAICNCMLVFILPVIFNWRLRGWSSQPIYERLYGIIIVLIGIVGGIFGAIDAINGIISQIGNEGSSSSGSASITFA